VSVSQRILLASAQEDFEFPLAEAARKQIFARAEKLRDDRREVEILIVTPDHSGRSIRRGIPVREVARRHLLRCRGYCRSFDSVHYLGTVGIIALVIALMTRSRPRTFTATDGAVFSTGPRAGARRLLARYFHRFYDEFRTYTDHQRRLLLAVSPHYGSKLTAIRPILEEPILPAVAGRARSGILYIGHLSYFKGVDIVMEVFRRLVGEMPHLTLTIAANGLSYEGHLESEVKALAAAYPGRVLLKGKVNVYDELTRAGLLMYPIRSHAGTFAVPLSLCESLACGAPFLSSRLDGLSEYFDDYFLCQPGNIESFVDRARRLLSASSECRTRIQQNLQRIREACRDYEHCC